MVEREKGFSMLELLSALLIMGVIAAMALPTAITAVKNYRLHSDATALASFLNVVRMKGASQFAPYRLVIQESAIGGTGTYAMEKLCGITPSTVDINCTSPYQPFTTRQFDLTGTQYLAAGNSMTGCRPTGVGSAPISTINGDQSSSTPPCSTQLYFYFNTRGLPVDNSGNPLANGGDVVYIQNPDGLKDAITISLGGRVATWNWSPTAATWMMR